jgi:hypothetical protein
LHSTGQLHKGGGANGVFLQMTAGVPNDLKIPGETFTFGQLCKAQSLGDFQSLASRKRRAVRIDLGVSIIEGLNQILQTAANPPIS